MDALTRQLHDAEAAVRAAADELREQARRLRPFGVRVLVDELEAQAVNLGETAALIVEQRDLSNAT